MKKGISLIEMATELERQVATKKDFTAPTAKLLMLDDAKTMRVGTALEGPITVHAERQLAAKLEIPVAYYDRLRDNHPVLLAQNVNTLFQKEPKDVMVRTLDNKVRAILSDRFRPLDNFDLFAAIYPVIKQTPGIIIESAQLTDTKLYIKFRMPWLDRELEVPEGLKMGVGHNWFVRKVEASVEISNSEIGYGAIALAPAVFENECTNFAKFKDQGFGKMHVGKSTKDGENVSQYLSNEAREARDRATWIEVRDVLKATMDGRVFENIVKQLQAARTDLITGNPVDVVEVFATQQRFTEAEKGGLLKYLVEAGELNRYGLQWAVTKMAGDDELVTSYDRASELERLGGQIIELPQNQWREIAKAVAPAKKAA